jgi:hypothetical protein
MGAATVDAINAGVEKLTPYFTRIETTLRGSSKYLMTINCIYTTTPRMQFCEWLRYQHTADEILLRNILWRDELCFTRKGVFNIHNCHVWARDNPHAVLGHGGLVRGTVVSPYLLTNRLVSRQYREFFGNRYIGAAIKCASSCEAEFSV